MINLTINKADLKRQLADELAEIRDGNSGVTATALVFTKDDRYSLAVSVTADRIAAYKLNVRTYIGGEAADGNTEITATADCYCSNIADVIDFVVTCAACADLDAEKAKKDNATALAHLDAQTAKADAAPVDPAMVEIIHNTARKAAKDLDVYATDLTSKRQGLRSARECVAEVRREIDFHLCSYSEKTGCRLCADILAAVVGIKGATATAYAAAMRSAAAALREIAGPVDAAPVDAAPVDPAGREFYVATVSGVEGNQVVVDTVRAASEEAAALDVAARVYGGAFFPWLNARRGVQSGAVVFWLTCTDRDGYAPITVHAVNPELAAPMSPVRTALVCAMADRDRPLQTERPSELLAIAQARRASVQPGRDFLVATLSGTDDMPIVVTPITLTDEIITAEGLRPCDLSHRDLGRLAARLLVRFVYDLGAQVHCASTWSDTADGQYFHIFDALELDSLRIMALVSDPRPPHELADMRDTLIAAYRNNLCLAAATIQRRGQTVARERANTTAAPCEFYAATLSGTAAHPEVVERVTAANIDAAADMVAARTYGGALSYGDRRRVSYDHGAALYWYRSTGGSLVPVVLAPTDRPFNVDTRVSAVMRRDGMTQTHVIVSACLEWAQLKRGEIVTTADGLSPWTVIAVYPDNGQIHGEHVLARDGSHALTLVAAGMCVPDNDEDGTVDCDLICAIAGHLAEPNLIYAGEDVVSAAQYLANHGAG